VTPVNDAPVIAGQEVINVRSGRSTALQVSSLIVNDPDTANTSGFTLRILPGTNYTSNENILTPVNGHVGTLTVRVVVNDGVVDSQPYDLTVEVVPAGSKPLITGQQSLIMDEDTSLTLKLTDLFVTDDDDDYPNGFTLFIHPGERYTFQGRTLTPKQDYYGPITVNVTVSDGEESSDVFPLKIYVIPVNDAPVIAALETTAVDYEPGTGPMSITASFTSGDIDDPYLSFAEVAISDSTFDAVHDELIFESTDQIRGVYDPSKGILSLIGQASLEKYDSAIRTIKYNYVLTVDEEGNQTEVLPGERKIYFTLSDGQLESKRKNRTISIETSVQLDIPNTFTPNGDKANDTWHVRPVANASRFNKASLKVYTRKGLLIYESKGFDNSWDGSFNGEMLPMDTYYYTIDLNLSYVKKTYKGTVMILR
jgi:gliding motility-associated-like protein